MRKEEVRRCGRRRLLNSPQWRCLLGSKWLISSFFHSLHGSFSLSGWGRRRKKGRRMISSIGALFRPQVTDLSAPATSPHVLGILLGCKWLIYFINLPRLWFLSAFLLKSLFFVDWFSWDVSGSKWPIQPFFWEKRVSPKGTQSACELPHSPTWRWAAIIILTLLLILIFQSFLGLAVQEGLIEIADFLLSLPNIDVQKGVSFYPYLFGFSPIEGCE